MDETNVDITVSAQVSKKYHEIDLAKNLFYPIFLPFSGKKDPIFTDQINEFFKIVGYTYNFKLNFTGGVDQSFPTQTSTFEFIPCKEVKGNYYEVFYEAQNDFVQVLVQESGMCPNVTNFDHFKIKGGLSENESTFMDISIYPCQWSESDNCAPLEDMTGASLIVIIPKFSFDSENFTDPIKISANLEEELFIIPGTNFRREFKFFKTELWDDSTENIFAKHTLKSEFYSVDPTTTKNYHIPQIGSPQDYISCSGREEDPCTSYYDIMLKSGLKTTVIKRKYTKAADVLGEIGGIEQLVILGFGIIGLVNAKCSKRKMARDIAGDLMTSGKLKEAGDSSSSRGDGVDNQEINSRNENQIYPESGSFVKYHKIESISYKEAKERRRLMEEVLGESLNGMVLLRDLNDLKVVSEAFLQSFFEKLIPFALVTHHLKDLAKTSSGALKRRAKMNKTYSKRFKSSEEDEGVSGVIQLAPTERASKMLKQIILDYLEQDSNLDSLMVSRACSPEQNPLNSGLRAPAMNLSERADQEKENKNRLVRNKKSSRPKRKRMNSSRPKKKKRSMAGLGLKSSKKNKSGLLRVRSREDPRRSKVQLTALSIQRGVDDHKEDTPGIDLKEEGDKQNQKEFHGIVKKQRKRNLRHSLRHFSIKK